MRAGGFLLLAADAMFGLLIPCGGGTPIVLRRDHILVGRRLEYAPDDGILPAESGLHCELVWDEQGWTVRTFHGPRGVRVRVNGARVETCRLESGDTLFLAGRRYRIEFSSTDGVASDPVAAIDETGAIAEIGDRSVTFDEPRGLLVPQGEGRRFPLVKPTIVVGSSRDSDLVLPGLTVAPHHCRLDFDNGWWRVTDTSRGLGMRVDHIPVQEHWLYPGDVLTIAMFRYELHYPVGVSRTGDLTY